MAASRSRGIARRHWLAVAMFASWPAVKVSRLASVAVSPSYASANASLPLASDNTSIIEGGDYPSAAEERQHRFRQEAIRQAVQCQHALSTALGRFSHTATSAFCGSAKRSVGMAGRQLIPQGSPLALARDHLVHESRRIADRVRWLLRPRHDMTPRVVARSLFAQPGDPGDAMPDFFLFIKDYGWSLRYRISRLASDAINLQEPLRLEWIRLRKPVRDAKTLLTVPSEELFNFQEIMAPGHKGFKYHVTRITDGASEAVINMLDGKGISLLVGQGGIQLLDLRRSVSFSGEGIAKAITHCWVQCLGMPLLPMVKSVSFYNSDDLVLQLKP